MCIRISSSISRRSVQVELKVVFNTVVVEVQDRVALRRDLDLLVLAVFPQAETGIVAVAVSLEDDGAAAQLVVHRFSAGEGRLGAFAFRDEMLRRFVAVAVSVAGDSLVVLADEGAGTRFSRSPDRFSDRKAGWE